MKVSKIEWIFASERRRITTSRLLLLSAELLLLLKLLLCLLLGYGREASAASYTTTSLARRHHVHSSCSSSCGIRCIHVHETSHRIVVVLSWSAQTHILGEICRQLCERIIAVAGRGVIVVSCGGASHPRLLLMMLRWDLVLVRLEVELVHVLLGD